MPKPNETHRYTKNGEWLCPHGEVWRVGLAQSTAEELGDVTFVEAPVVGRIVSAGEAVCTVEAVKAAADFYSPVGGRILEANPRLGAQPSLVNTSPEEEGWLFSLGEVSSEEVEGLLDAASWEAWETGR